MNSLYIVSSAWLLVADLNLSCSFVVIKGTSFTAQDLAVHSVSPPFVNAIKMLIQDGTGLGVRVKLDAENPTHDLVENYVVILYGKHLKRARPSPYDMDNNLDFVKLQLKDMNASNSIAFVHKDDVPIQVTDVYGPADEWCAMSQELVFDLPAAADPEELTISSHGLDSPTPSV
jgi:hypothetical protein